MDNRDLLPVPTAPVASPAGYPDARSWAEAEIAEWLTEADEEASAIIDRARAEALRCELAGYEELERLREEAVNVRMATAERVARRLNEARFEADQLLAEAGTQAETMVDEARDVIRGLLGGLAELGAALPEAAGSQVAEAAAQLEGLLSNDALAIPGRRGVLDLTGAVLLGPTPGHPDVPGTRRETNSRVAGGGEVVMDDTDVSLGSADAGDSSTLGGSVAGTGSVAVIAASRRKVIGLGLAPRPPKVLALPVKAGEGLASVDDILPSRRPSRTSPSLWWDRLARFVRRAA